MRWIVGAALALLVLMGSPVLGSRARADGVALSSVGSLHDACRRSQQEGDRELFVVDLSANGWDFDRWTPSDGFLPIATRRNLRAFRGAVELFPSGFESIGFIATAERARALAQARSRGAVLRLGFFLGFDNPHRSACLLRPTAGVTTVRFDVAFVELTDGRGRVLAREDDDRLRAWLDDRRESEIPGTGPRGVLGVASSAGGELPAAWRDAIGRASAGPLGRAIAACHADGVQRGASGDGEVVVRVVVDARGTVRGADVELTSIGDADDAECIARAVGNGLSLTPDPSVRGETTLSVPVRLASD